MYCIESFIPYAISSVLLHVIFVYIIQHYLRRNQISNQNMRGRAQVVHYVAVWAILAHHLPENRPSGRWHGLCSFAGVGKERSKKT